MGTPATSETGVSGQDRESYSDTQDRESYTTDPELDDDDDAVPAAPEPHS